MDDSPTGWTWSADANVFAGFNYQQRHFADFSAFESQNWGMIAITHRAGRSQLSLDSMLSLEPLTIPAGGSPQLFQTGESYKGTPLVNYQHPHDFVMSLGAAYREPDENRWNIEAPKLDSYAGRVASTAARGTRRCRPGTRLSPSGSSRTT
jgi:hypothetical protein